MLLPNSLLLPQQHSLRWSRRSRSCHLFLRGHPHSHLASHLQLQLHTPHRNRPLSPAVCHLASRLVNAAHNRLASRQVNQAQSHLASPLHSQLHSPQASPHCSLLPSPAFSRLVNLLVIPVRSHLASPLNSHLYTHRDNPPVNRPPIPVFSHLASRRANRAHSRLKVRPLLPYPPVILLPKPRCSHLLSPA